MEPIILCNDPRDWPLTLRGRNGLPPVAGCRRKPDPLRLPHGSWQEVLEIELKGTGCTAWLHTLQAHLALSVSGQEKLLLSITPPGSELVYSAEVSEPVLTLLGNGLSDRAAGYQGIELTFLRRSRWCTPEQILPLQNPSGTSADWLTVYNHTDSSHAHWFEISAAETPGTDPAPLTLDLDAASFAPRTLHRIVLSGGSGISALNATLEGESASVGVHAGSLNVLSTAAAGAGQYLSISWQNVNPAHLCSWALTAAHLDLLRRCGGVQPVLKTFDALPANLRLHWRLTTPEGFILDESAPVTLVSGHWLHLLPPLSFPVESAAWNMDNATLQCWVQSPCDSPATLTIDFIQLLPLDQFVLLEPLSGLTQTGILTLRADPLQVECTNRNTNVTTLSHLASGNGLYLQPGLNFCGFLLWENADGAVANDMLKIRVKASPSYEVL
ncbi:MAG TPA: hypothetical protein PKD55_16365 [Bellilinea sp.]|nr:hypothetical protein [Bellilinea sp.]